MRVVIVTNSLGGGGAERAMNLLANELHERSYSVTLIPINQSVIDIVKVKSAIIPINRKYHAGLLETFRSLFYFRKLMGSLDPQIVLLNCDLPELFGLVLSKRMKQIIVEHSKSPWANRKTLGRMVRFLHRCRSTTFFAVSPHLKIWPGRLNPEQIVPNLISISKMESEFASSTTKVKRLVFIGRLSSEKRPLWVLEIAQSLSIPVLVIGAGNEDSHLRRFAELKGISTEFAGYKINPWELVEAGDLLLVPSLYEGDGLVVIEAIALGIPILLSDITDFRRFHFPDFFYAGNKYEFVNRIRIYENSLSKLVVPKVRVDKILEKRAPKYVGDIWETEFSERQKINE